MLKPFYIKLKDITAAKAKFGRSIENSYPVVLFDTVNNLFHFVNDNFEFDAISIHLCLYDGFVEEGDPMIKKPKPAPAPKAAAEKEVKK